MDRHTDSVMRDLLMSLRAPIAHRLISCLATDDAQAKLKLGALTKEDLLLPWTVPGLG